MKYFHSLSHLFGTIFIIVCVFVRLNDNVLCANVKVQ